MLSFFVSLLCFVFVISFCGCSDKGDDVSSIPTFYNGESTITINANNVINQVKAGTVDIEYEDINDNMLTQTIALKMSSMDFRDLFTENDYFREEGERYIRYTIGGYYIYFTNDNSSTGIAVIVNPSTAYGFEPTISTDNDIKSVLGEGVKFGDVPEEVASMLLFGESGYTYRVYNYGDNTVAFFFGTDGKLSLSVINQNGLWIY